MKRKYQKPEIISVTPLPQDCFMQQIFDTMSPSSVHDPEMESNEYDDSRYSLWFDFDERRP